MTIDWTKPLEHVDGTPVRLAVAGKEISSATPNPDSAGDRYLVREDGQRFTREQRGSQGIDHILIVGPSGSTWREPFGPTRVRNRAEWGAEIEVNGVRPDWLRDGDLVMDVDPSNRSTNGTVRAAVIWGFDFIKRIRLPADHPYYTATEKGFTYWPGGDSAPADWDGGQVLLRDGERWAYGYTNWRVRGTREVIGYHPKPATEFGKVHTDGSRSGGQPVIVDWTKPIEAVRKSDGRVVPVTLESGPDGKGFYTTVECPHSGETNYQWTADGKDRCRQNKWFVRNRAAINTVTLETLTVADAEARMLDVPTLQELGLIVAEPIDRATELTREILAAGSETVGSKIAAQKYRDGRYDEKPRFIAAREIVARELAA